MPRATVLLAALALLPAAVAQAPATRELQIRAALVYKIARFVTWPETALPARGTFTFCFVSDDSTARVLGGIEGRATQNHRTRMRRLMEADAQSVTSCNLLYLTGTATLSAEARAAALATATLLVVDGPREGPASMVQLVPRDNRVSLVVDLGMVRAARLRIDAPLLQLVEVRQ